MLVEDQQQNEDDQQKNAADDRDAKDRLRFHQALKRKGMGGGPIFIDDALHSFLR